LPLPLLPEVTVIQLALFVAVQEQPPDAVTLTAPVTALELKDWLEEDRE
jgi:hypothetical protein